MNQWLDVSQPLHAGVPTWPGDTPFAYRVTWPMAESGSVNVGEVTMSIHTGTHIDAPFHFDDNGKKTTDLDVNIYIGPARVVHLPGIDCIHPDQFTGLDLTGVQRLIVRTDAWPDKGRFPEWIPPVDAALAPFLKSRGVVLLGLDLPSVDVLDSKPLPAHHALAANGVHILEGLVLDAIEPGDYELAAVPLPLVDADGSPVRALLRHLCLNQNRDA